MATNIIASVLLVLSFFASSASASSSVVELWRQISFTTESGDQVLVVAGKDSVNRVEITLEGKHVAIPAEALRGLGMPVLQRASLVRSFGVVHDQIRSSIVLEFPILDLKKASEKPEDMAIVWLVIEDNRVSRRDIWENGKEQQLRESITFSPTK